MLPKNCRECLDLLDAYNDSRLMQAWLATLPVPDSLDEAERDAAVAERRNQAEAARLSSEMQLAVYQRHVARHDGRAAH